MKATIQHQSKTYQVDLSKPIDISMALKSSNKNVNAWYVKKPKIKPIRLGNWIGKVKKGAPVNFNSIKFSPHAHGTHTECVGHITKTFHSINDNLKQFFFVSKLITVAPELQNEDLVISKHQIKCALKNTLPEALIIRTLPNTTSKKSRHYSNTNPPYLLAEAAKYMVELGIKHLLIDLPSIDKEKDGGKLAAHHAFWNTSKLTRYDATITEFIYVPNTIKDGNYLLNLQIAPFDNDASPSKPILYQFEN